MVGAAGHLTTISLDGGVTFGRIADMSTCVLDHPTVSKRHASIARGPGGARELRDLGSTNGTFVNGKRLTAPHRLKEGDEVRIGPFAFVVRGDVLSSDETAHGAGARTRHLSLNVAERRSWVVRIYVRLARALFGGGTGATLLLDDVSVAIRPGEFVGVIGPSGCGKTTLIRMLGGRASPTSGQVSWNDFDLQRHFDTIKHNIAFVPQRETLPEFLTVRAALTYTARLRLAADLNASEIDAEVRAAVGRVALGDRADVQIRKLSGGERKRASLANELLARPKLMLLDEVTSGLDEATDHEIMELLQGLANERGITIICVTHTLTNVAAWCDSLIVMAKGGVVAYHGPVTQAEAHFGVKKLGHIYRTLAEHAQDIWAARHATDSPYVDRVREEARAVKAEPVSAPKAPPVSRGSERRATVAQLRVLVARYLDTVRADNATLAMAALQSVVIGAFLRLVFGGTKPVPPLEYQLVFLLGVSAFWFGCNNAAKEIIKEHELFALERDVNLRIVSYVLSKLAVLTLLGVLEVALLFSIVRLSGLTFSHSGAILFVMMLALIAGSGCGLLISAASISGDQAVAFVPIALIPQILLSDAVITPLPAAAKGLARAGITAYWTYRAELQALGAPGIEGSAAWLVLVGHVVGFTLLAMAALWWRDRLRRR